LTASPAQPEQQPHATQQSYVALRQGDAPMFYSFATKQHRFLAPAKGPLQLNAVTI